MHLVGGDLALDFVNTQTGPADGPVDGDALDGYDDLLSWSRQMGTMGERQAEALALIAQARPATASAAFRKAVGARSYLREIFATLARQQEPSASMLDLLRGDAASSVRYARLARTAEGFGWDWAICDDLRAPLWPVIQAAVDLMRSGPVTSVKQCGGLPFPLRGHEQERQPALVQHGGLRQDGEDAQVRGATQRFSCVGPGRPAVKEVVHPAPAAALIASNCRSLELCGPLLGWLRSG